MMFTPKARSHGARPAVSVTNLLPAVLQVSPESLDWENLSYILKSVLSGLARVHARGIVHLDLKPANILKCGGRIVVADFGIARWSHMNPEDESVHGLTGTPNYMAPEQISCRTNLYGPWTDLYALGCLAYTLVAGQAPFARSTLMDTLLAHKTDPMPQVEERYALPNGFDDWLYRDGKVVESTLSPCI